MLRGSRYDDVESGAWKDLAAASFPGVSTMTLAACSLRVVPEYGLRRLLQEDLEGRGPLVELSSGTQVSDAVAGLVTGRQVLCGDNVGILSAWDVASKQKILELRGLRGHQGPVKAAAVSVAGGWLATVSDDGTLRVWDPTTGTCVAIFTGDTRLTCVAAVGRIFAAGSASGAVHIVELVT
jgi:WD40 repeat protein